MLAIIAKRVTAFDKLVDQLKDSGDEPASKRYSASERKTILDQGRDAHLRGQLSSDGLTRLEILLEKGVELSAKLPDACNRH